MPKLQLADVEQLITGIMMPFYHIDRDMLVLPELVRTENDAEHSWALALIAAALAEQIAPELDRGLITQFAVVHDLVELYAGDTTPWDSQEKLSAKEAKEADALHRLEREYGQFPWILDLIHRYEAKDSEEATFVWAADKLLALYTRYLDRGYFYRKNKITLEAFKAGMVTHQRKGTAHPAIAPYYEQLMTAFISHTEYFYPEK